MFSKIFKGSILAVLMGSVVLSSLVFVPTKAQGVGMRPDSYNNQPRSVFRIIGDPGQKITDYLEVSNRAEVPLSISLKAKDNTVDNSGDLSYLADELPNKGTGNWVSFEQTKYTLDGNQSQKVPFTVNIPSDTAGGEYAVGITSVPVGNDASANVSVSVSTRIAISVYITVKGDLKLDNKVSNLQAVNPKMDNFIKEIQDRNGINLNNLTVKFDVKNAGNIYSILNGNLKVTAPDGKVSDFPVKKTLWLNSLDKNQIYIETNLPYQVGKTSFVLDYSSVPYNFTNELKYSTSDSSKGQLTSSIDLGQSDLDNFKSTRDGIINNNNETFKKSPSSASSNNSSKTQPLVIGASSSSSSSSSEKSSDSNNNYTVGGSVIILLLLIIIIYMVYKETKEKKENKTERKEIKEKKEENKPAKVESKNESSKK